MKNFLALFLMLAVSLMLVVSSASAVEGYKDIYLDREKDTIIHSLFCGKDLKNMRALKPSYAYTNTQKIEEGTYYYNSAYGKFSYTFKKIEGTPEQVLVRGLLRGGETDKKKMAIEVCIVDKLEGLPAALLKYLVKKTVTANDPGWDKTMVQYTALTGKPAFAKGVYQDQRSTVKYDAHDQTVFDANQAYIKSLEQIFAKKYQSIANALPGKLEKAILYARQEDGFLKTKVYPVVKEPAVWTVVAKKRYNDQMTRLSQEKSWDVVIQQNFDWYFSLVGKDNKLVEISVASNSPAQWDKQDSRPIRTQLVTVLAKFADGKTLELDYDVKSGKADGRAFETLQQIKTKSSNARQSLIASDKKLRKPRDNKNVKNLNVYSPTEKVNLFFSTFRHNPLGQGYRYH